MRRVFYFISFLFLTMALAQAQTSTENETAEALKAPEILFGESAFSFADPEAGCVINYYVDQTKDGDKELCVNTYTGGEVAYAAGGAGKYYVHAYASPAEGSALAESELATGVYFVLCANNEVLTFYELITDVNDLNDGDMVIIASGKEYSQAISTTQQRTNRTGTDVDIWSGMIAEPDNAVALFKVTKQNNLYSFYNTNGIAEGVQYSSLGYLYAHTSTFNEMKTTGSIVATSQATVSIAEDGASSVKFGGAGNNKNLRYNPEKLFSCYPNTTTNPLVYFYVLHRQAEYAPTFADMKMSYGGERGNIRQLELGEEHPALTYAFSKDGVVEISEDGTVTTLGTGDVAVTVSWANDLEWKGGEVTFNVSVKDYALAAPAIELGESSFTLADNNPEGSKLYYCVTAEANGSAIAAGDWMEYGEAVAFSDIRGKHYVHAVAKSTMEDLFGDSPAASDYYYTADLEQGEYVLLTDINKLKTDDMVIIATNDTYSKAISSIQDKNNRQAADVEIWRNNVVVEPADNVGVFKVTKYGEGASAKYSFYSTTGSKGYIQATSSSYNLLQTLASVGKGAKAAVTLDPEDGHAKVKFDSYSRCYLGLYTNGTAFSYACYAEERTEPIYLYVKRTVNAYAHPFESEYTMTYGGTIGATIQFDLGAKHPEISYAYSETDIVEFDANGLMTAKAEGLTTVTASWEATDEWKAGSTEFTVSVVKAAPEPDNLPEGNYDGEVTLKFGATEGCDIYYITNKSAENWPGPGEFDENDMNCWAKLEGDGDNYEITLDAATYGETPWIKVVYASENDGNLEQESAIGTYHYTLTYTIYAPAISDEQGEGLTRLVSVDFDERNAALKNEGSGYTLKYQIKKDATLYGNKTVKGTEQMPVSLDAATYGFRPVVKAWIEDAAGNKLIGAERTIYLDGNEELESWTIHGMKLDTDGNEEDFLAYTDAEGLDKQLSYKVYTMQVPVHTFHRTDDALYITDNTDNERSCIRLIGAPDDMDEQYEIEALRGRFGKEVLADGTEKHFMLYMSHEDGEVTASPLYRVVSLNALMLDKDADRNLDHHYIRLTKVYYDADMGTISVPDAETPAAVKGMTHAPAGHTVNVIENVSDPNGVLPATSGAYYITGYPSYEADGGMSFVALNAEEAEKDGDNISTAIETVEADSEGCEVYTLSGMRITTPNLTTGVYLVRKPDGKVIKIAVK